MLAIVGPIVRLSAAVGLLLAAVAAGNSAWAAVYQRLALGLGLAFVVLVVLSFADDAGRLPHRGGDGHRVDAAVLFRGLGGGDLARVASSGQNRGRVVHGPLVAGAAVRGAADRDGRRLLGALSDAARPGDRPPARDGGRVHAGLWRRARHDPAARGTARGRAGEPAGAAAGDRGRAGRRADHHRRARLPHRVRERRVLPRVRLLARGARFAAAKRAGRRAVARRHPGD